MSKILFSPFYPALSSPGIQGNTVPAKGVKPGDVIDIIDDILKDPLNIISKEIKDQLDAANAQVALALDALNQSLANLQGIVNSANADFDARVDALDSGLNGIQTIVGNFQSELDGKATKQQLIAQINRLDGQEALIGTLNTTINDLPNQFVSASTYQTLVAEVTNARAGTASLSARFAAQTQAFSDGLAGKAGLTQFNNLNTTVSDLNTTVSGHSGQLTTIIADLAGKANVSQFNTLSASITSQGQTISAHSNRLDSIEVSLEGKASVQSVTNLGAAVNQKGRTFFQSTTPENTPENPLRQGDLWVHTGDGRKLYAWTGTEWTFADDQTVSSFIAGAITRFDRVDADISGKASVSSVESLTQTVNGHTTEINTTKSIATDAQGKINAAVRLKIDGNGVSTGFENYLSGTIGGAKFSSDVFEIVPTVGSGSRFRYQNGKISIYNSNNVEVVQLGLNVNG